jgi:redox-regulated HSP33 family molecular chaperone
MTLGSQIAWDDTVLPFQLDRSDIRGRVVRLDGVLDRILAQHDYPKPIEALVAEAALLTALIGQTIKLRWKLSLQIRGEGPARLIATDYYAPTEDGQPARIRAYAGFDPDRLTPRRTRSARSARATSPSCSTRGGIPCPTRGSPRFPEARWRPAPRPISRSPNSCPRALP